MDQKWVSEKPVCSAFPTRRQQNIPSHKTKHFHFLYSSALSSLSRHRILTPCSYLSFFLFSLNVHWKFCLSPHRLPTAVVLSTSVFVIAPCRAVHFLRSASIPFPFTLRLNDCEVPAIWAPCTVLLALSVYSLYLWRTHSTYFELLLALFLIGLSPLLKGRWAPRPPSPRKMSWKVVLVPYSWLFRSYFSCDSSASFYITFSLLTDLKRAFITRTDNFRRSRRAN